MSKSIICTKIAQALNLPLRSVENVVDLLEGGSTIPFISRYRKEATGSMDEIAIGDISKSWTDFNELVKRKAFVLQTIQDQGKLSDVFKRKIEDCWDAVVLEDLYLPYKKKRKTKATVAKERGLSPLAELIWSQRSKNLEQEAKRYLNAQVRTIDEALQGGRDILAERINESSSVRKLIRHLFTRRGRLSAKVVSKKRDEAIKYKDYFDYAESASSAPAHRLLAVIRAEKEGLLKVKIDVDEEEAVRKIEDLVFQRGLSYECEEQLRMTILDAYKRLLSPSIETEFRKLYKDKADTEAIHVFMENLKQLLLSAPLGSKRVMGIDPGFRSGCKVVCLDENGDLIHNTTIYPHPPQQKISEAKNRLNTLVDRYDIQAIAVGNGTAGKESFALIKSINFPKPIETFLVNENGASIYSASEIARKEFPDYDLTVRGAVSIGRRLMDPLSELVKIDPKSIGVGQYQHDVNQSKLKENLTRCVEHCVNAVGIDLNTASEHVLGYVSGLGPTLAKNIVEYRSEHGSYEKIETLKKVPRMGAKAFEQSAGFLRIRNGKNPLDNTAVHPERYRLVKTIAKDQRTNLASLIGNQSLLENLNLNDYASDEVGLPTLKDILKELKKPGFDIRGEAQTFEFTAGINEISDVQIGMTVRGIINNITKFGAFVDIGIKEAGLIHISQLADRYVSDPLDIVKLNQEVTARVLDVDLERKRISLSLKEMS